MDRDRTLACFASSVAAAPAVPLALALLAGTALGRGAAHAPAGPLVGLVLLGVAFGAGRRDGRPGGSLLRGGGFAAAALAAGFLNGHLRGGPPAFLPDPDRPVTGVVETTGHWRRLGDVWSAPVRVVSLRQGRRVLASGSGVEPIYLHARVEAAPSRYGARLRVKGYLGRSVRLGNPTARAGAPPGLWRLRVESHRLIAVEMEPGRVARLSGALRERVENGIETAARGRPGVRNGSAALGVPLARALLLGDASDVPPAVVRGFRRLGLAHLLAVSGLHVGLVTGLALVLAAPLPRVARWLAGLAAAGLYLLLVGPRPSLLRASAMAGLAVAALLAERPPSARNALAVAALAIVAARPAAVGEVGFQLSVGATAGLLWLGPRLAASWEGGVAENSAPAPTRLPGRLAMRLPAPVRDALAVSAGAQLGTLPWALPVFCLLVPAAPLVNLVAVPWAAALLVAAGIWAGLAAVVPAAAASWLPALDLLASPAAWPAALPASVWASLPLALGPWAAALLAGILFAALLRPRVGLPVLAAALAWTVLAPGGASGGGAQEAVELVMIDVGQGDAILLRDGGETLLVDGGGWPAGDLGGRVLVPALAALGVRSLDRVLLTHPDRDHCGGLVEVAGYVAVAEVWTGPAAAERPGSACEAALLRVPGAIHRTAAAGDRLAVGRWRLRVLHPERSPSPAGANDGSVVLAAEAFGRRVLLTGDVEAAGERELLARFGAGDDLDCDVLKVAHHGSRTSSDPRFLAAATPALALVGAGARNPYGHPAAEVLERLAERGTRVLRTDRDGMVVLRFHPDGRWAIDLPGPFRGSRAP